MTLEEVLRRRTTRSGSTVEVDTYIDEAGRIHMTVVGFYNEQWQEFIVTGNKVTPVEEQQK